MTELNGKKHSVDETLKKARHEILTSARQSNGWKS